MNRGFLDSGGRKNFVEKEVLSPSVVDETVAKEKQRSLLNTTRGYGIDVVFPVESIRTISERFANTVYGFFLGKRVAYPVVANYVRNTWGKYGMVRSMFSSSTGLFSFQFSSSDGLNAMLENDTWFIRSNLLILKMWHPDVNTLKEDVDNIVADMPKIVEEGYYTHNICVEYVWKRPRCACCKVFVNVLEECPKNIDFGVTKKKTSGGNAKEFRNKNKNVKPTNEVSKSNSFDALNLVDNDVEFGTNRGYTHLASQEANSSSSTFWNADSSSPSTTTPIIEKINNMKNLIIDGKAILVDNEENLYSTDGYGQEIPKMLQAFCNRLDINVRGRMKK
ncbi:reverse transcriptase domain, reverse transcriptase zinc-binding domain protein [Tanacetum coccineum]|uniref:Reverse transcriptase domain, reverse transcriptase zinc-binding domain protein n=1 Tax=Tanacetum coccineum TaxID=301880 RepID=A0ABQ5F9S7_9ASTR